MGVVYIGDRATGKTALMMKLIEPQVDSFVQVTPSKGYDNLKNFLFDETTQQFYATGGLIDPDRFYNSETLEAKVKLPAGLRKLSVNWIDTPGEVWRKSWPGEHPSQWQEILSQVQQSEGILLILPPHRGMPGLKPEVSLDFPTPQQWCNRFCRWSEFFQKDCPEVKQIVICLNKADLFSDHQTEASKLAYSPHGSPKNWYERDLYTNQTYFNVVQYQITELRKKHRAFIRCFITSIYNRTLLELPWIYLASHLTN